MTIPPEARRTILVGAYEEDALFELLRSLAREFGGTDEAWLEAIRAEASAGLLDAYRYGPKTAASETTFLPVDLAALRPGEIGEDYRDPVYLAPTRATAPAIRACPAPEPGDDLWVTGFWGKPPVP